MVKFSHDTCNFWFSWSAMRFILEKLTKRFIRSLKMTLGRRSFIPQSLTIRLQRCGFLRFVQNHPSDMGHFAVLTFSSTFADLVPTFLLIMVWLQVLFAGGALGVWAYQRHRQKNNVLIMAWSLLRGVPLTSREKQTMLELLVPPPPPRGTPSSWWRKWQGEWLQLKLSDGYNQRQRNIYHETTVSL